jgi:hypothetical protein
MLDLTIECAAATHPSPPPREREPDRVFDGKFVFLRGKLATPSALYSLSRLRAPQAGEG